MAIQTKFVVSYRGQDHEFNTEADATRFDAQAQRADKIAVLLLAKAEALGLTDKEQVHAIAMALADLPDEMGKVFAPAKEGKKGAAKGPKGPRKPRVAKPSSGPQSSEGASETPATFVTAESEGSDETRIAA